MISCRQVFITLEYDLQVCECAITYSGRSVILLEIKQNFININFVDEPLPIESSKINLYNKKPKGMLYHFIEFLQKKKLYFISSIPFSIIRILLTFKEKNVIYLNIPEGNNVHAHLPCLSLRTPD